MIKKSVLNFFIEKIEAINKPNWSEYNMNNIKFASIQKDNDDYGGFDIKAAIVEKPEHLFVKIFAIKKDEVNDNGDAFSERELKKAASTFIGVPIFTNHQNTDIEKAKGKCVHAWYDDDRGGVYIIAMIDRVSYPKLARGIEEGYTSGTSMGCQVSVSLCSICHLACSTPTEYCSHIQNHKNKKFSGKIVCQYHNSKEKVDDDFYEDKCPICGSSKDDPKELIWKEAKVYEHNFNLKFIEDSIVVNPACHDCLVCEILNPSGMSEKIAEIKSKINNLQKVASINKETEKSLEKFAGKKELEYLSDVLEKIEAVTKSMMAQKQQVSMEYVSDLVDVMASVQSVTDELIEMGYAQLPSPTAAAVEDLRPKKAPEINEGTPVQPVATQPASQSIPPVPNTMQREVSPGIVNEQIGNLGNITKPKYSKIDTEKKKDFLRLSDNLIKRFKHFENTIKNMTSEDNINKESIDMANTKTSQDQGSNEKVAESHDTSVILEKQLVDAKFTGERIGAPGVITEKQLDNPTELKNSNVTTSASPQKRTGSYDVITEKQLDSIKSGYVVRWNEFPNVITEKQWTDVSRMVGSVLNETQDSRITEKQLQDFMSHHRYIDPSVITEKQLNDQKSDLSRWAYTYNANALLKSAMQTVSDVIAFYGKTPSEIKKASEMNTDKASLLVLVNALPHKSDSRLDEKSRYTYFNKLASSVKPMDTIDALVTSMADHLGDLSATDLVDTVKYVINTPSAFMKTEKMASSKIANGLTEKTASVNKTAELKKALAEMNKSNDGLYQIRATYASNNNLKNKTAFINNVHKFANAKIAQEVGLSVETILTDVDIDSKRKLVVATLKDISFATPEEKESWNKWNKTANKLDIDFDLDGIGEDELDLEYDPEDEEVDITGFDIGKPYGGREEDFETVDKKEDKYCYMEGNENDDMMDSEDEMMYLKGDDDDEYNFEDIDNEDYPESDFDIDDYEEEEELEGEEDEDEEDFEDEEYNDEDEDEDEDEEDVEIELEECPICHKPRCNCGNRKMMNRKMMNRRMMEEDFEIPEGEDVDIIALSSRKENRKNMVKEAQLLGGEMGGQAGASQGPGAGAALPANAPASNPPVQNFENDELGNDFEDEPEDEQPKPPGAICPVCGSEDVDIIRGSHQCNHCSADWTAKVQLNINWPGITTDQKFEPTEDEGEKPEPIGKGFEMPEATAPTAPAAGGMPAAASTKNNRMTKIASLNGVERFGLVGKITPKIIATLEKDNIKLGSVSPITGTTNTMDLGNGTRVCLDTGSVYNVRYAFKKDNPKDISVEFSWKPIHKVAQCSECEKARKDFVEKLAKMGIDEIDFDTMSLKQKGETIMAMKQAGILNYNMVKIASAKENVIEKIIKNAGADTTDYIGGKFPMEDCMERLARRYGKEALAMSGPCEGKKLANCICESLKRSNIYSSTVANKVASVWAEKDGSLQCIEACVREGFELRQASFICDSMKNKYASFDDVIAQQVGENAPKDPEPTSPIEKVNVDAEDPFEDEVEDVEVQTGDIESKLESLTQDVKEILNTVKNIEGEEEAEEDTKDNVEDEIAEEAPVEEDVTELRTVPPVGGEMKAMKGDDLDEVGDKVIEEVIEKDPEDEVVEEESEEIKEPEEGESKEHEANETLEEEIEEHLPGGEEYNENEDEEDLKERIEEFEENKENKEKNRGENEEDVEKDNLVSEGTEYKEGEEESENEKEYQEKEAQTMRNGYVGKTDEIVHLNMNKIYEVLKKANKLNISPAQDNVPFEYKDNKAIGDENKFEADKPDVPSKGNSAKMGKENPPKAKTFDVPAKDARMSGEKDNENLEPELDDTATGGMEGAGSSKAASIMDRVLEKLATQTERKFPQEEEAVKPYSSNDGFIGSEKESIGEVPEAKSQPKSVPTTNNAYMGNEKESIGDKPNMPNIPTADARMKGEKDNKKIAPEEDNKMMGIADNTVTAESKKRRIEASRVAGRMLKANMISEDKLADKIAELETYKVAQIKDLEKGIFTSTKGLKAPSSGLEQAVVIPESLSIKQASQELTKDEIVKNLQDMFKLSRQNEIAQSDDITKIRKNFGR